jgi:Rad3-related DNA helicase
VPEVLDQGTVRAVGLAHGICPYYLSQDLARWCDLVIGDYNYYFDLNAMLHVWTSANQWRVGVLVDEAHNLLERARGMYSATLDQRQLRALRSTAPERLRPSLATLSRVWNDLHRDQVPLYQAHAAPPPKLMAALQQVASTATEYLATDAVEESSDLLRFHFDVLHFLRLVDSFGEHSLFDISRYERAGRSPGGSVLCLRNVVPAPFLRPRLDVAATSTLFSATLGPRRFHADMLGLPRQTAWVDIASPFATGQLAVHVASHVSTRFDARHASIDPIVHLLSEQYRRDPGNYLAFFSSFDYMKQVADRLAQCHPRIPARAQFRGMKEAQQSDYLAGFKADGQGHRLRRSRGFLCRSDRPAGRPIEGRVHRHARAAPGQPGERADAPSHAGLLRLGFGYAYLIPGMQKVVQAAGRVIRTPEDRGVLYLIDDRFARSDVRRLLPPWWTIRPNRVLQSSTGTEIR